MYHSRAFPCVSRMKYRLWKRQLFSFSSMSRKPHTRFSRSTYGMLRISHITGTRRETHRRAQVRWTMRGKGERAPPDIEDEPAFIYCSNSTQTDTQEERDQPPLSSFSCDVIEAEQQTPKPEAEPRPSTAAKNYRLHSGSAHFHWSGRRDGGGGC